MKNLTFVHFGKELFIPESGRMTDSDFLLAFVQHSNINKFCLFHIKGKNPNSKHTLHLCGPC